MNLLSTVRYSSAMTSEHGSAARTGGSGEPDRRVVVFGVDGVRLDTLAAVNTPVIDAVAALGFLGAARVNDAGPTISGPSWATMATGVLANQHGIVNNEFDGHRLDAYPDFLARVRRERTGARTYAAADWAPLVRRSHGGPVFAGGGYFPVAVELAGAVEAEEGAPAVADDAARVLGSEDVDAAFVYFVLPDLVAHRDGVGDTYRDAIERSDRCVGQVLEAIAERPSYADEEWTVIVATDHGHVDGGGHGGDSDAERTAWIAASGPEVPDRAPEGLEQADVCAQVLTSMRIPIDPAWGLVGRPFADRR